MRAALFETAKIHTRPKSGGLGLPPVGGLGGNGEQSFTGSASWQLTVNIFMNALKDGQIAVSHCQPTRNSLIINTKRLTATALYGCRPTAVRVSHRAHTCDDPIFT